MDNVGPQPSPTISIIDHIKAAVPQSHKKDNNSLVNECISEGFMKLSVDDRNKVEEEICGNKCMAHEETPEMLETSLANLKIHLDAIPYKKKVGYNKSQELPKSHINDDCFRLRFLRSQFFDEREAALRLVKYCDFVLELFGSFALERHIRLEDFQKKEKKWLQKGYVQLMPFRDQSGRRIILQIIDSNVLMEQITRVRISLFWFVLFWPFPAAFSDAIPCHFIPQFVLRTNEQTKRNETKPTKRIHPSNPQLKLYHYTAMVATEDVESQRRGVVLVVWPGGAGKDWSKRQLPDKRARHLVTRRHEVIPMRYAGYHYCMPEIPVFRLVRAFAVLYVIRSEIKSRMKFHIGTLRSWILLGGFFVLLIH